MSASTDVNAHKLAEFFVEHVLKECVLPPSLSYVCHEDLQLCNFRKVSIEEVRQAMTRLPVKCYTNVQPT